MDTPNVDQRMYICTKCWRIGTAADFPQGFHCPCAYAPTKADTHAMFDGHQHCLTVSFWESLSENEQTELYEDNKKFWGEINQEFAEINQHQAQRRATEAAKHPAPHCPTCGSTDVAPITNVQRAASLFTWGFASGKIGKQFECKNCGYKW